jgi:3-hydroxy acid dehydrogenase/malonic semialdehyde reductase
MKTILITGASSGIGKVAAQKLSKDNNIILCARRKDIIEEIASTLPNALAFTVDVRNEEEVERMFLSLEKEGIVLDAVINSAGLALGLENLEESDPEEWTEMIDTNIKGLLLVSKFSLKQMKVAGKGHIINIGSIAGINSYARGVVYAATKAAVKSISDGLRKEVVEHNIRITNIQPGLVETNFSNIRFRGDIEKAKNAYTGIQPLSPEDVVDAIEYVLHTPVHVQINEITMTPVHQATVEVIYRKI